MQAPGTLCIKLKITEREREIEIVSDVSQDYILYILNIYHVLCIYVIISYICNYIFIVLYIHRIVCDIHIYTLLTSVCHSFYI